MQKNIIRHHFNGLEKEHSSDETSPVFWVWARFAGSIFILPDTARSWYSVLWISVLAQMVLSFEVALWLWKRKIIIKFLLAPLKTVTNSKVASEFLSCSLLLSLVNFLQCTCHRRLSEQFSELRAAFGTTFRDTAGNQKVRTNFLKRVTGKIFVISKWFQRSKQKLYF